MKICIKVLTNKVKIDKFIILFGNYKPNTEQGDIIKAWVQIGATC